MGNLVKYLIYSLGFIVTYFLTTNFNHSISDSITTTNDYIYLRLSFIVFGIFCTIPYILDEFKKSGRWKCDYIKLLVLGIPSFYFSFSFIIYFYLPDLFRNTSFIISNYEVPCFILGYILLSSFYKGK